MTDPQQDSPASRLARVTGTFRDSDAIKLRMAWAQDNCNFISPASHASSMPEGCGVALSVVQIDIPNDTYDVGFGKRGLFKPVLQKLAAQLGISWDERASGRIDDGSDPYYCRWRAVGTYRSFDGQIQTLLAEKELDLREGSPTVEGMYAQRSDKGKTSPEKQIREMRIHIQAHTETKAQLRAIRSLGIKTAYTTAELQKPFVAARIMFTGQTNDPALRQMFAEKTADSFLSGRRSLYPSAPPTELPKLPPPPRGSSHERDTDDDDDDETDDDFDEETGEVAPSPSAAAPPRGGFVIPGGNAKGTALNKAELKDLEYWSGRIGKDLQDGACRDEARDKALHAAMVAEIASRALATKPAESKPAAAAAAPKEKF